MVEYERRRSERMQVERNLAGMQREEEAQRWRPVCVCVFVCACVCVCVCV